MFDIGFWELAVLGVIGLIVLGPERLPVVARTLGRWAGRARHYVNALTTELENEIAAEDIRKDVRRAREQIESETREFRESTEQAVSPLMEPIEGESERAAPAGPDDSGGAPREASESDSIAASEALDSSAESGAPTTHRNDENRP
ncbi:Sec-independent protein translocase protein TatB [Salinisphaera hydrothermalis]|uniref:Sec-independent protein translocase protein TatB n=1 Tax=Salinisphaera hydrothermalis (strain C41B8) TaxID=1304275 RepID=A0A084IRI3_SALHC|nr:Sec-independent protein translocase protein TatB [Salinisphaera hydrothermalis]KEZ79317.1 Sec-independent protein translocase TatB [Salinisphaera hydrothermalis C41B8]